MTMLPEISHREWGIGVSVKRRRRGGQSGFTLIELLIVVAIIAILVAILVPNFLRSQAQARLSSTKAHMRGIANALESYFVDNNAYPPTGAGAMIAALQGPPTYVQVVPRDSCTRQDYIYTGIGAPPSDYVLETPSYVGTSCAGLIPGDRLYYRPGSGFSP